MQLYHNQPHSNHSTTHQSYSSHAPAPNTNTNTNTNTNQPKKHSANYNIAMPGLGYFILPQIEANVT
jgi:hypothetical protein